MHLLTLSVLICFIHVKEGTAAEAGVTIKIFTDLSWVAFVSGNKIEITNPAISSLPYSINSLDIALKVLQHWSKVQLCIGNPDKHFYALADKRQGQFKNVAGDCVMAVVEEKDIVFGEKVVTKTIRHTACASLASGKDGRCLQCRQYRATLNAMYYRLYKSACTCKPQNESSSGINFRFLTEYEKIQKIKSYQAETKLVKYELAKMQKFLDVSLDSKGMEVSTETNNDLLTIMKEHASQIEEVFPNNSFRQLFWKQQMDAALKKNPKQMRWHPLMVKFCLSLKLKSSSTYEGLYNSGLLRLPSQRTLQDYTHVIKASSGFMDEIDLLIQNEAKLSSLEEWQKHIVLIHDEMHIKEDLVFDKVSGELVGFTSLGNINDHLLQFEEASKQSLGQDLSVPVLANSVLMLMVRGVFIRLCFPYAQFPCKNISGEVLYPIIWEAIQRLERCGFKVLAIICDGASSNRRFIHMHAQEKNSLVYKTKNPFSLGINRPYIFFVYDVPHLIKTARNCLENPKRLLWVMHLYYYKV